MSAPDITTLYAIETAVETAAQTILQRNSLTVYISRSNETQATPFVAVKFTESGSLNHFHHVSTEHLYRYPDQFGGNIQFAIATNRTTQTDDSVHNLYKARIRELMFDYARQFDDNALPYHEVFWVRPGGTTPSIETEGTLDISTISFDVKVAIRKEAWI